MAISHISQIFCNSSFKVINMIFTDKYIPNYFFKNSVIRFNLQLSWNDQFQEVPPHPSIFVGWPWFEPLLVYPIQN